MCRKRVIEYVELQIQFLWTKGLKLKFCSPILQYPPLTQVYIEG